ncbi:hypothetical protein N0V83_003888 [Neocucurbitaria cava]|uniref:Uncharacterized protein n=1 Tax=Neocucurbitaria cava TaxID=798079 RepID=A0A9W9CNR2_9PLEO|nr:hypothetical protein N0V83_003888 [Neocucurbitaria cava]
MSPVSFVAQIVMALLICLLSFEIDSSEEEALAESLSKPSILHAKDTFIASANESLKEEQKRLLSENAELQRRIASKDAEGYDLQMQIQYKAEELHEMTFDRNTTKEGLSDMQVEFNETKVRLREYEAALDEKENELENWWANTAGTIHALQRQIEDYSDRTERLRADQKTLRSVIESRHTELAELSQEKFLLARNLADLAQQCEELCHWQSRLVEDFRGSRR